MYSQNQENKSDYNCTLQGELRTLIFVEFKSIYIYIYTLTLLTAILFKFQKKNPQKLILEE